MYWIWQLDRPRVALQLPTYSNKADLTGYERELLLRLSRRIPRQPRGHWQAGPIKGVGFCSCEFLGTPLVLRRAVHQVHGYCPGSPSLRTSGRRG